MYQQGRKKVNMTAPVPFDERRYPSWLFNKKEDPRIMQLLAEDEQE